MILSIPTSRKSITGDNTKLDDPRILEETRQYIRDFNRIAESAKTALDLYTRMLALYPDRVNPGALWASARALKH